MQGKSANVRAEADAASELVGRICGGEAIEILGEAEGWYLVRGESIERKPIRGYVKAKFVAPDGEGLSQTDAADDPAENEAPPVEDVAGLEADAMPELPYTWDAQAGAWRSEALPPTRAVIYCANRTAEATPPLCVRTDELEALDAGGCYTVRCELAADADRFSLEPGEVRPVAILIYEGTGELAENPEGSVLGLELRVEYAVP